MKSPHCHWWLSFPHTTIIALVNVRCGWLKGRRRIWSIVKRGFLLVIFIGSDVT